jgi:hypothetical protein
MIGGKKERQRIVAPLDGRLDCDEWIESIIRIEGTEMKEKETANDGRMTLKGTVDKWLELSDRYLLLFENGKVVSRIRLTQIKGISQMGGTDMAVKWVDDEEVHTYKQRTYDSAHSNWSTRPHPSFYDCNHSFKHLRLTSTY